jgi:hypothetical protein
MSNSSKIFGNQVLDPRLKALEEASEKRKLANASTTDAVVSQTDQELEEEMEVADTGIEEINSVLNPSRAKPDNSDSNKENLQKIGGQKLLSTVGGPYAKAALVVWQNRRKIRRILTIVVGSILFLFIALIGMIKNSLDNTNVKSLIEYGGCQFSDEKGLCLLQEAASDKSGVV